MNNPRFPWKPPSQVPVTPLPPPKINAWALWITLLAPSIILILLMLVGSFVSGPAAGTLMDASWLIMGIVLTAAWIIFARTILDRFSGTTVILIIIAYPLLQGILIVAIIFVGCLTAVMNAWK